MGMYDTINGEQIKVFCDVCPSLNEDGSLTLHTIGGSLKYYGPGNRVPYKTHWYNMGKDFDIIDLEPYDHDKPMVHQIRSGINTGFKYLDDVDEIHKNAVTDHGVKFINPTKDSVKEVIKLQKMRWNVTTRSSVALSELNDWRCKNEGKPGFKETFDQKLEELKHLQKLDEKEIWEPICKKTDLFLSGHFMDVPELADYQMLGAIESNKCFYKERQYDSGAIFIIQDERLSQIICTLEMEKILEQIDINDYFKTFDFTKKQKEIFWQNVDKIRKIYEEIKDKEYTRDQFFEKNALKDIESGRYKEAYLKYNILPYKNFDYSMWDKTKNKEEER